MAVNGTCVANVNVDTHCSPTVDLMVEFGVRTTKVGGVADDGDGVNN